MKSIFTTIAFSLMMAVCVGTTAYAIPVNDTHQPELSELTVDQIVNMTARDFEEISGTNLNLRQKVVFKMAQNKLKKAQGNGSESKNQLVALILCILVGVLGIHRFYLGYTTIGIIQLLTAGGCGIWTLVDLIMIITGDLKPADGSNYDPPL